MNQLVCVLMLGICVMQANSNPSSKLLNDTFQKTWMFLKCWYIMMFSFPNSSFFQFKLKFWVCLLGIHSVSVYSCYVGIISFILTAQISTWQIFLKKEYSFWVWKLLGRLGSPVRFQPRPTFFWYMAWNIIIWCMICLLRVAIGIGGALVTQNSSGTRKIAGFINTLVSEVLSYGLFYQCPCIWRSLMVYYINALVSEGLSYGLLY